MNKKLIAIVLGSLILFFVTACNKQETEQNLESIITTEDLKDEVLIAADFCDNNIQQKKLEDNSYIVWDVKKVGGFHTGTVPLKGFVSVCDGLPLLTEVLFYFDSLTVSDLKNESMNQNLVNHLKSADFFDTENYKTGLFISKSFIQNNDGYNLVGDLIIKGITNEISFPIQVSQEESKYKIYGEINIDRTLRDIMYQSNKLIDTLKDSAIEDNINLSFEIKTQA